MPVHHTARQFWIKMPGQAEIRHVSLGVRSDGDVLVRTLFSGISRGTESLVFRGEVPPSMYESMRAPFQEGTFPGPVKYGYSSVGVVEEGITSLVGKPVFCLYPHQDLYHVPVAAVQPVPEGVPAKRAVLAANMETAVNILWDARPCVGDRVVIIGAGVVGFLVAILCKGIPGCEVTVVDPMETRKSVAAHLGLVCQSEVPTLSSADVVVHSSGTVQGLRAALTVAGEEATIIDASWYGTKDVPLPLGERFHSARLTIKSSQVGRLPVDRLNRWTRNSRLTLALELLRDKRLDVLINRHASFETLPAVMNELSNGPSETLCHLVHYDES
jgi:NADPH:quinone reductase-like Zn-dependent oxidoreductase